MSGNNTIVQKTKFGELVKGDNIFLEKMMESIPAAIVF